MDLEGRAPDKERNSMTALSEPLTFSHGSPWPNRIALAPLTNKQSHPDGTLSDDELVWLEARGRGGFGQLLTAAAYVSPAGQVWEGQLGISSDAHIPGLARLAQALKATGAATAVQLHHGGRRADRRLTERSGQCPWDDPAHDSVAMSEAEINEMVDDFIRAALRAESAGFDGVQLHGAHGYLLGQFLDSTRNHRVDAYGGSFENRLRVVLEVIEGIRHATGPDFHIGLRITPEGNGIPLEDGRRYARVFLASGLLDHLDVSLWDVFMRPRGGADGLLIDHFVDLPRGHTRLGVAGNVLATSDLQWCLDKGADFISVGRGAILHHDFASQAIADPAFRARSQPASRSVLTAERVGPAFIRYLETDFEGLVS
jgi:2,4-dienoyl-CoA reductase-like NADH-dependent reductase (Old Yellow Enzyme family)